MKPTRMKWTAVAIFAALLTIGEAFAIHAATRDARRWLASDEARAVRHAGEVVVAAVMTGKSPDRYDGRFTAATCRHQRDARIRAAVREARAALRDARRVADIRARIAADGI